MSDTRDGEQARPDAHAGRGTAPAGPPSGWAAAVLIFGGLAVLAATIVAVSAHVPLHTTTSDPTSITGAHWYVGMLANLGVVCWAAAATAGLLAALVLRGTDGHVRFFVVMSMVSAAIMLDDLLLLHSQVIPYYTNAPESAVLAIYVAAAAIVLWKVGSEALNMAYLSLALAAGAGLLISLMMDSLIDVDTGVYTFAEDVAKFIGAMFWAAYVIASAVAAMRAPVASRHRAT